MPLDKPGYEVELVRVALSLGVSQLPPGEIRFVVKWPSGSSSRILLTAAECVQAWTELQALLHKAAPPRPPKP